MLGTLARRGVTEYRVTPHGGASCSPSLSHAHVTPPEGPSLATGSKLGLHPFLAPRWVSILNVTLVVGRDGFADLLTWHMICLFPAGISAP